jgi:hypothetical protein
LFVAPLVDPLPHVCAAFQKDLEMKIVITIAVAVASIAGIPLMGQDSGADANATSPGSDSAKVTYAPRAGGFGDLSASHAYEMIPVTGELDGKLDSKTARVGDRVVLKTLDKVQTSGGTVIPRGSRLVGHVTEVQAYDPAHGPARIAIAFDHAELKNGQSIAVYTLIGGVTASSSLVDTQSREDDGAGGGMMGMPVRAGSMANGGRMGPNGSGGGGPGGATNDADRASDTAVGDWRRDRASQNSGAAPGANSGSAGNTTAQGGGGLNAGTGAHAVAAARAVPHTTEIPGVLLAGNSSSSGVLLSLIRNIQFESGTEIQLGVATGN